VKSQFAYDTTYDPPAPVLPILVANPTRTASILMSGLVDTGADISLLPTTLVRRLLLPRVSRSRVRGVTGEPREVWVHVARINVGKSTMLMQFLSLGSEMIVGRDLLSQIIAQLDGPASRLSIRHRS